MNPYQPPSSPLESAIGSKLFCRSNWIAGLCLLIFALLLMLRGGSWSPAGIKYVAVGFWCVTAFLVFRFPRQMGIVIGLFMLAVVFVQHHFYEQMISNFEDFKTPDFEFTPRVEGLLWRDFCISVIPLIVGAPFAIASTWFSRKRPSIGEQSGADQPLTAS